jgi:predicted negative regulator of RcsB-dependent stress response
MESHERHELKQNDLQEFFLNFREWWQKHGNTVLIVLIVCVLGVGGYMYFTSRAQQTHNAAWQELASANNPEALQAVAEAHDYQAVPALARYRAADLLLAEAINPGPGTDRSKGEALSQAASLYETVANDESTPAAIRVNARLGLASVAETRNEWQAARNHYKAAIDLAEQNQLQALASQAKSRRDRLDQLSRPVQFVEGEGQSQTPGGMPQGGGALPPSILNQTGGQGGAGGPGGPGGGPGSLMPGGLQPPATQPSGPAPGQAQPDGTSSGAGDTQSPDAGSETDGSS